MKEEKYDVIFVSNYSDSLNRTLQKVAHNMDASTKYKILTYRKTDIDNATSYEEFIADDFDKIIKYSSIELQNRFKDVNFMRAIVSERNISNYYYGIEKTLGNKIFSYQEVDFLIKSYTLFLERYIKNSKIIFGGYADNFISTLVYLLSKHYNKKCLSFHPHWIIDNQTCYINEGIGCSPVKEYITNANFTADDKNNSHIKSYDNKKHFDEYIKKNKNVRRGLFGVISPNIFDIDRIKFMLYKHTYRDKRIDKFLNIDKPYILKKTLANIYRAYNKFVLLFFKKTIELDKMNFNEKIIYFPLQIQPEASTSSRAPYFINQLEIIFNISKSLPLGHVLIVKEHPMGYGMRDISFYRKINSLSNVFLIKSEFSGKKLIKESELIIGFGGTTLFEAVSFEKKYLLLTEDYIYTDSLFIRSLNNISTMSDEIKYFLDFEISDKEKKVEAENMVKFFYERGFPLYEDIEKDIAVGLKRILNMEMV